MGLAGVLGSVSGTPILRALDEALALLEQKLAPLSGFRRALLKETMIFDRPPLIPSRGEGKKCRRANGLFVLSTGGGVGVGDPIENPSMPRSRNAVGKWDVAICPASIRSGVRSKVAILGAKPTPHGSVRHAHDKIASP